MLGEVAIEYITPFKHFDPNYIVAHQAYNPPLVVLDVAIIVLSLAASYWLYMHRNIPAVV